MCKKEKDEAITMTRTVRQIKMAKIYVPKYFVDGGQGFGGNWVKETVYYEGAYTNKTDMEERFAKAKTEWDEEKNIRWGACCTKVVFEEWWEILEILD
jgi:hypothetical protein